MQEFFENLKENENADFQKSKSKWWNGHAYFPLFNYYLNYKYLSGIVKIHYEFRQSEFTKPSMVDSGAFGDRHNYQINCVISVNKTYSSFSVYERRIFEKLFKKDSKLLFRIKCKEPRLREMLRRNQNLNKIFEIVENSPEFSPLIEGKMNKENYQLKIIYSTQQENEKSLKLINDFCKNVIENLNR